MKNPLIPLAAAVLLAACSYKPPQPYGKFFPINQQTAEVPPPESPPPYLILEKKHQETQP